MEISAPQYIFQTGSRICLTGPSMSGKTSLFCKIIKHRNQLFEAEINKLIMFCGIRNEKMIQHCDEIGVEFENYQGLAQLEEVLTLKKDELKNCIVLLDDLQAEIFINASVSKLMTIYAHHYKIGSVFITSQSLYGPGKQQTTFNRNVSTYILMRSYRLSAVALTLSRQLQLEELPKIYSKYILGSQVSNYPYLVISLETPYAQLMFSTNICSETEHRQILVADSTQK